MHVLGACDPPNLEFRAFCEDDGSMPQQPSETLALRVQIMPPDTNPLGTVFGGVILSLIDQAGFDQARQHGRHRWVTVAFRGVEFKKPVFVGDRVSLYARTIRVGSSSVEVGVRVEAQRFQSDEVVEVTSGEVTMVSIDSDGRTIPFSSSPTLNPPDEGESS